MQINRMFEIIYILLDRKMITAKELADHFEVSVRTIYRDIDILSAAGIPIYMSRGKGGGISILDDFILNKAVLTNEEKSNILTSLKAVNAVNFNESNSAISKLGSLFGKETEDWIEIDFSSWYNSSAEILIFNNIKTAIQSKSIINFKYSSGKGVKTQREAEPLKICFKGMSRYLYAYCRLRKDFRFFKLSRITELEITNKHFDRTAPKLIFENETDFKEKQVQIKLRISPKMEYRVYDEFDSYVIADDGSFIVETLCPKNEWLFSYIASYGGECEVLQPPEIRDIVKNEIKKMAKNYSII